MKTFVFILLFFPLVSGNDFIPGNPDNNLVTKDIPSVIKKNNQPLFYIERSKNKNRVYYDANFNADGSLNSEHPIDVYWLNLEENYGKRGELSYIQEKLAYGFRSEKRNERLFEIKLKAFDKRPLLLLIDNKGHARIQIKILGKSGKLHHLYIKATDRGIAATVEYVELFGTDIITKTELYEKILP